MLRLLVRFFSALASMMGFGKVETSKSDSDPSDELEEVLKSEKWSVRSPLGKGVSGGVFLVEKGHLFYKKAYALKIMKDKFMYENERNIMEKLQNSSYFPQLIQCRRGLRYHFILMSQHIMTAAKVFKECVEALKVMHEKGLLHRDLKPFNILISMDGRRVLLADFGHSGKYVAENKEKYASCFIGTPAYASLNVQAYFEPTPRDDLLSLFYTAKTFAMQLIPTLPDEFWNIYSYLSGVSQFETPDYAWVMQQLDALMDKQCENRERKYDWELIKSGECEEEIIRKMNKHRNPRWSFFSYF
ncbi:Tau-tubulin kinase [Trichinella spiralis]|uniref:non-specific serine/threonine protein kinase n=1 Tax=Trichinella spiralis TaxID=6334 RepID=A0ABR3K7U6_TRISP